jgi:oligopeptide transport system substrate-binding protein
MSGWRTSGALRFLLGLTLLAALDACARRGAAPAAPAPASGPVLRIAQRNEPADLDPQTATLPDEFFLIRALSEGLVTPNPNGGAPLPGVAERWDFSRDGLVCRFRLRGNACWSNGDPVTARDFLYSYRRILTPALAAPKVQLFFAVKNAEAYYRGTVTDFAQVGFAAPNDRTLVVRLAQPAPSLLALAASGPWIPVHPATVEKFGGGRTRGTAWTLPGHLVGNGPFTLAEWRPHQEITVRRNPAYWDAAHVRLAELHFLDFDSGDTEERAFRTGQIDITMAVPFTKLAAYATAHPPVLRRAPLFETRYLALNVHRPPLHDPRVRRALALAIDRSALVERVLQGGQQPARSFLPPGLGGYQPGARLAGDSAEARRLLAEAGYPEGRNFPSLEVTTWVGSAVLEAIQEMWRQELGVGVTIAQREGKIHVDALQRGDFAIGFVPAIPDFDDAADVFGALITGAANNFPHWSNRDYDRLVAEGLRTANPLRRQALYREAESILMAELPVIPLYFNTRNYLVQARVHGWQEDRLWNRFYKHVTLDEN